MCAAELRQLKTLDPKVTENIGFYIVGSSPAETIDILEQDRQEKGYPWPVAELTGSGLRDFKIVSQSTKIAVDSSGVITYREGFRGGDLTEWQSVFESLAASSGSS